MDFDEILCMQYCDQRMKFSWTFQQNYSPYVKIWIFLNIFRNNEWILIKFCLYIDIWSML